MLNKNAQIGETMTWVVATIVIIVILTFSIFIASSLSGGSTRQLYLKDKQKDFIATKSIINFLSKQSNFDLIEDSIVNSNCDSLENNIRFRKFLSSLAHNPNEGWNFEGQIDKKKCVVKIYELMTNVGQYDFYETNFEFDKNSQKIKLKFWKTCQGCK